jgi:succinate dehydrogenase hydrophobic anchor subunit
MRDVFHYTSYGLAAGFPAALFIGSPISSVFDYAFAVAIPLHFHIGMRSVLIDYVHDVPTQQLALGALAGVTVLTTLGLLKFNLTDVGITEALKQVWVEQEPPKQEKSHLPKF